MNHICQKHSNRANILKWPPKSFFPRYKKWRKVYKRTSYLWHEMKARQKRRNILWYWKYVLAEMIQGILWTLTISSLPEGSNFNKSINWYVFVSAVWGTHKHANATTATTTTIISFVQILTVVYENFKLWFRNGVMAFSAVRTVICPLSAQNIYLQPDDTLFCKWHTLHKLRGNIYS